MSALPGTYPRADKTRTKILKAARKLFVENGFAGTSMGKIAEKADVNHSLLFHHFGNKQKLWLAVKMDIVTEAKKVRPTLPEPNASFEEFIKTLFDNLIYFYRNNPDIQRMIQWQRLEKGRGKKIVTEQSEEIHQWRSAFRYYQNQGDISKKINLDFLIIQVFSLASTAALDPILMIEDKKLFDEYIDYCVCSVLESSR